MAKVANGSEKMTVFKLEGEIAYCVWQIKDGEMKRDGSPAAALKLELTPEQKAASMTAAASKLAKQQ